MEDQTSIVPAVTPGPTGMPVDAKPKRRTSLYNANCLCCRHPGALEITSLLAGGMSCRQLSRRFSISEASLRRHRRAHIGEDAIRSARRKRLLGDARVQLEELRESESLGLLGRLQALRGKLNDALATAEKLGDARAVAQVAGRLHENATLVARLLGDLGPDGTSVSVTTNVQQNAMVSRSDDLRQLRDIVETALAPFPQARNALLAALASRLPVEAQ